MVDYRQWMELTTEYGMPLLQAAVLANVARMAILIFTGAMALYRAGLAPDIVTLAFGA